MKNQEKKGILLIGGGFLALFVLPPIFNMIGHGIGIGNIGFLGSIVGLGIIVLGILQLIGKFDIDDYLNNNSEADITPENSPNPEIINQQKIITDSSNINPNIKNKVINVSLKGGIIGFLTDSPQNSLNRRIKAENAKGWKVVQIIPASSGNLFLLILRLFLLIITLLLYTTSNGYYIIMEKTIDKNKMN